MLNSVLKQLGVSELQVLGLAVLRGQSVSAWELKRKCFEFIYCGMLRFREAAGNEVELKKTPGTDWLNKLPCPVC